MKKNILFITWDGAETSYAESLFMPIYDAIQRKDNRYQFHYLQFTWKQDTTSQEIASEKYNIPYSKVTIRRKPIATIGSIFTLLNGSKMIQKYVKEYSIDILMPRSNFPAYMVLKAKLNLPVIFDADGLPIEERVAYNNLGENSMQYKWLRGIEQKIIIKADLVLTRSQKAIGFLSDLYRIKDTSKFNVVINGRDENIIQISSQERDEMRKKFNINKEDTVLIYVGSYGHKYAFREMIEVYKSYKHHNKNIYFIILSNNPESVKKDYSNILNKNLIVRKVPFYQVNEYLNAADVGIGLIYPTKSMKGASAIKYAEYLLAGLPTIASIGIGDSEQVLKNIQGTYLFNHEQNNSFSKIIDFINNSKNINREDIRSDAIKYFSLEAAANSYICSLNHFL